MDNLTIKEVTSDELEEMSKYYSGFEESKTETVERLFETLKSTRAFHFILDKMTYEQHSNGNESVECFFKYRDGSTETISVNVTCDSCAALIQDVWKTLYKLI